jgi:hypothetical protein
MCVRAPAEMPGAMEGCRAAGDQAIQMAVATT